MPLIKSKSDKAFKSNIKAEMHAGKPMKQAVAIAYKTKGMAKKADGGPMDDDDYDAPPRTRYRPAPDARNFDSDIDYRDSLAGSSGKTRAPLPPSIKPNRADEARKKKINKKNDLDTKIMNAAQKSGNKDIAEKAFVRRHVRSRSEGLQSGAKMFPNSAPKMRKQWSEEIGKGKPAPFKTGGKAKSCW
jgi:hypothetical protein